MSDGAGPDDLERLYRVRFSPADAAKKQVIWRTLCRDFFQRFVKAQDVVLDIACGYGEFSNHIVAGRKIAIDLNPDAARHLPTGVEFHRASADDLSFLSDASVDVCFSSNFFEHLPSKAVMDRVLAEALRVLRPGGHYVALQPNLRFAPGEYWDYYDHVLPLTDRSAAEAFAIAGFDIVRLEPRFLPFSTRSRLPQHAVLISLYLKLPLAWQLLGRQFLLVARKPTGSSSP